MSKTKRILGVSAIVALASQINIRILETDFRISAGIIFLALYLFYYKDSKPIPTGIASGIAIYIIRLMMSFIKKGDLTKGIFSYQLV